MNCEIIQELILTDYADNQASSGQIDEIKKHIASCQACRLLESRVKTELLVPFQKSLKIDPPAHLWHQIKTAIESSKEPSFITLIFEKFKESVQIPRPAFAFSAAAIMLFIAIIATASPYYFYKIRNQQLANSSLEEHINYLSNSNGYANSEDTASFGTSIEEYFL